MNKIREKISESNKRARRRGIKRIKKRIEDMELDISDDTLYLSVRVESFERELYTITLLMIFVVLILAAIFCAALPQLIALGGV